MHRIPTARALDHYYEDLVYLEATLLATDDTATFAPPVTAQIGHLEEIRRADLDTRRSIVQAQAGCAMGDVRLDMVVDATSNAALYSSGMDRKATLYSSLFPIPPFRMTRFSLARQVTEAKQLQARLTLSVVPEPLREEHGPLLAAAITDGEALLEKRKAAELQRTEARLQIADFKEDTNALRLQVYSQLIALAASERRPRGWAEAFFRARSRNEAPVGEVVEVEAEGE